MISDFLTPCDYNSSAGTFKGAVNKRIVNLKCIQVRRAHMVLFICPVLANQAPNQPLSLLLHTCCQLVFAFYFFFVFKNTKHILPLCVTVQGNVIALYGETITVPCNGGAAPPDDLMFIKWKYVSKYCPTLLSVKCLRFAENTSND